MKTNLYSQVLGPAFKRIVAISITIGLLASCSYASHKITGIVTDNNNSPLIGVNVILKGTSTGVVTDVNGRYQINVPDSISSILAFNFVGYEPKEIKVRGKNTINVLMKEDVKALEELAVVGYGAQKKKERAAVRSMCAKTAYDCASAPVVFYNPSIESYSKINENGFKSSKANPLSTFSIDVDRASYSNVRRFLTGGEMPPVDAVRIEEMINYFEYDYPQPKDEHPFSITTEYAECPWQADHRILHIGIQGKKIPTDQLPSSNLVFLIDVSGSMDMQNKLPLLKSAFKLLVNNLREKDKVAIVVYAGAAGLVLPSTHGDKKLTILEALDKLQAGGSTAGAEGIRLAYETAQENFIKNGNNRIILATDGDFNVGLSNENDLETMITEKRKTGIYLTCLGFGMGNYKDSKMEILADKGNGNYAYINDVQEANKVLVNEFGGTLFTIAKDVKIQVEFNPEKIQSYRLIGYENRLLNEEDFKDDTKDAGELGSGHTVTALYEVIPTGVKSKYVKDVDPLKYQKTADNFSSEEIATVKFRYKKPDGEKSIEMIHPISGKYESIDRASENIKFSASVAMFGMLLRNSEFKGTSSYNDAAEMAEHARSNDKDDYKAEYIRLVKIAGNGSLAKNE